MLSLAFGIIFFVVLYQRRVIRYQEEIRHINEQKQRELIQASIQGEEEERMRIAEELHDDVGATLSSVRLFLHIPENREPNLALISRSRELLDDTISKIRNISHKLQPTLLSKLGLDASLESFTKTIHSSGNIHMSYNRQGVLPRMTDDTELSIYRIVQEFTNNIIKHSGADTIALSTLAKDDRLETTIAHNGHGLTEDTFSEGTNKKGAIGLKNIVNRLKAIDASITFGKSAEQEFTIKIVAPLTLKNNT